MEEKSGNFIDFECLINCFRSTKHLSPLLFRANTEKLAGEHPELKFAFPFQVPLSYGISGQRTISNLFFFHKIVSATSKSFFFSFRLALMLLQVVFQLWVGCPACLLFYALFLPSFLCLKFCPKAAKLCPMNLVNN